MKLSTFLLFIGLFLTDPTYGQTNVTPLPTKPPITQSVTITTVSGKTYSDCTVLAKAPEGITVMYSDGGAKILFSEMSPADQTKYGYDATKFKNYQINQEKQKVVQNDRERAKKILVLATDIVRLGGNLAAFTNSLNNPHLTGDTMVIDSSGKSRDVIAPENMGAYFNDHNEQQSLVSSTTKTLDAEERELLTLLPSIPTNSHLTDIQKRRFNFLQIDSILIIVKKNAAIQEGRTTDADNFDTLLDQEKDELATLQKD